MPEQTEIKLDRIADALGFTKSEARDWIRATFREPSMESRLFALQEGRNADPLDERSVAMVIESVVLEQPNASLAELERQHRLAPADLCKVCAHTLSRRYQLDPSVVVQAFRALSLSRDCVFVGASGRTREGRLIFGDARKKKQALELLEALREAALAMPGFLSQLVDRPDSVTGLPANDPLFSGAPWLREVPQEVYAPLLRWHAEGDLDRLLTDVKRASTGADKAHKKNVAFVARLAWETSGRKPSVRHDGSQSPFMKFASAIGRLFGAHPIAPSLLRATRSQERLIGVPTIQLGFAPAIRASEDPADQSGADVARQDRREIAALREGRPATPRHRS